ncbi:MAG: hypothetical protein ACFFBU_05545 [Promethearchaeota archaeon]
MKIIYQTYEPDKGLDELQVKIYSEASGLPARAEEIRQRNLSRQPEMTRYALTDKGEPLAYITARDSSSELGRTYIGYPWTMPGAPSEVQTKLFNDMFEYLKQRENTLEIATTVVLTAKIADQQFDFFKSKGFVEKNRLYRYNLDFDAIEVSTWKKSKEISNFNSRGATLDDLDLLIELSQADTYLNPAFPTPEAREIYFRDRVLKDGHAVIVFDNSQPIAASALLRLKPNQLYLTGKEERIVMRFTAIRPGYRHAWKRLLIAMANEVQAAGWAKIPLRLSFNFQTSAPLAITLAEMQPELELFEVILTLPNK